MKSLNLNAIDYDIALSVESCVEGDHYASVQVRLGAGVRGETCLSASEAKKIGEWFLKLSKEIK